MQWGCGDQGGNQGDDEGVRVMIRGMIRGQSDDEGDDEGGGIATGLPGWSHATVMLPGNNHNMYENQKLVYW